MKTAIIFHSSDFDGVASCLITRKYLVNLGIQATDIDLIGWTYGDKPLSVDRLMGRYDTVFIVDLCLPVDDMIKLNNSGKLVWIDHHLTSIQDSESKGFCNSRGLRRIGTAACELCWEFFFPSYPCPLFIQYLGAWDVFDKNRFDWWGIVNPIQLACSEKYGLNPNNWIEDLDSLLLNIKGSLDSLINNGQIIFNYNKKRSEAIVKKYGFDVTVAGKYKGICLLNTVFSSIQFASVADKYDCSVVVNRKGPDLFNISIYIDPEQQTDFNAGIYMKENYSGGGHAGAAGGLLNFEQFKRLVTEQIV